MPVFNFEAMDATGQEIKDVVEASNEEDAVATIRQMGYFVTKINEKRKPPRASIIQEEEQESPYWTLQIPKVSAYSSLMAFFWFALGFLTCLVASAIGGGQ